MGQDRKALVTENGFTLNGFTLNGYTVNGYTVNGYTVNGYTVNGFTLNGYTVNGYTVNALTANAMTANALTANAMTANALTANGLTANGLTANGFTANALTDPWARMALSYMVGCALPDGQDISLEIDGDAYTFHGQLGLAPEWGEEDGACDEDCQRWVTACLLARVNASGEHVVISVRGQHPALTVEAHELKDYAWREGAYYGNLFASAGQAEPELYACISSGGSLARVCGASLDRCPMTVMGECDQVCDGQGRHHSFKRCEGTSESEYRQAITVFLPN
jgi:hypothetical protein